MKLKSIPEHPHYYADEQGNIYSDIKRWGSPPGLMKLTPWDVQGYLKVSVHVNFKKKQKLVHRLVALAFLDPAHGKSFVNHKNMNKHDNRAVNLEWVTSKENNHHARANKYWNLGNDHHSSKLTKDDVLYIRSSKKSGAMLARHFNVSHASISKIILRKSWKHI